MCWAQLKQFLYFFRNGMKFVQQVQIAGIDRSCLFRVRSFSAIMVNTASWAVNALCTGYANLGSGMGVSAGVGDTGDG